MMIRRIESEAQNSAKQRARAIVADAIQRVASDQTAQTVVAVVHLPADEVKGRIIGREGRNIRAFETVTGVNVIIDDTPEAVLLSCFDPVRREIGRITLEMLIEDGRIHPHRIEEAYERARDEVEVLCQRAAEDAMLAVRITDLHPELVTLVGRLKYRTSYGQNVLGHLIETAHIARGMAVELGIDPTVVNRGAFLHDIGKALTHEAQGSHAIVGAELARKYGESDDVAHCIEAHHDEVPPATVEAVLTQAADACSGGRPGARRESLESYVQRLERIEAIAGAKRGRGEGLRHAGRPRTAGDGQARRRRRPGGARAGAGGGQADRGGADLPRSGSRHGHPRVPSHRDRPLSSRPRPEHQRGRVRTLRRRATHGPLAADSRSRADVAAHAASSVRLRCRPASAAAAVASGSGRSRRTGEGLRDGQPLLRCRSDGGQRQIVAGAVAG